MSTELYGKVDYARVAKAIAQISQDTKRIRGVEFPDYEKLPAREKTRRESQIRKLASDCGCNTGARIAVMVMLLYLVSTYSGLLTLVSNQATNYLLSVPVFLAAAVIGKLVGLKRLQQRLSAISNEIRADLLVLELGGTKQL